jgi:hypothetical protein
VESGGWKEGVLVEVEMCRWIVKVKTTPEARVGGRWRAAMSGSGWMVDPGRQRVELGERSRESMRRMGAISRLRPAQQSYLESRELAWTGENVFMMANAMIVLGLEGGGA